MNLKRNRQKSVSLPQQELEFRTTNLQFQIKNLIKTRLFILLTMCQTCRGVKFATDIKMLCFCLIKAGATLCGFLDASGSLTFQINGI